MGRPGESTDTKRERESGREREKRGEEERKRCGRPQNPLRKREQLREELLKRLGFISLSSFVCRR